MRIRLALIAALCVSCAQAEMTFDDVTNNSGIDYSGASYGAAWGDIEGDGKKELVLAAFSSGLWLLRPGEDPNSPWSVSSIDRDSGGFEHASILTDLDGDGKDELYVASDDHKEVRSYRWDGSRLKREVIYKRSDGMSVFTWNLMPVPASLVPR